MEKAHTTRSPLSRRLGNTNLQVACFIDHVHNAVLTGAGDPSSYSDDVLPDVYSGTFSYGYSAGVSATGARVVVQRKISDELTATVDYSTGRAISGRCARRLADSGAGARPTGSIPWAPSSYGHIPATGTRWIASYKWTSGNTLSLSTLSTPHPARPILT